MEARDAVIILRDGNKCMAFPGPGGYRIEWSDGTKIIPLDSSPSGHLVIPCDTFDKAEPVTETHAFFTDHRIPVEGPRQEETGAPQASPNPST